MSAGRRVLLALATAALYFAVAKLSLVFAIPPGFASAVWPPAGIAAAALILGGRALWPGVWLGSTAANLTVQVSVGAPFFIGAGGALEAWFIAWATVRLVGGPEGLFGGAGQVFRFVGVSLAGAAISASIANLALWAVGALSADTWAINWLTWWLGDTMGVILVTPLVLAIAVRRNAVGTAARTAELVFALAALLGITAMVFFGSPYMAETRPLVFLLVPPLVWIAARFEALEVTLAAAASCALAMYATVKGHGPFASASLNESLLLQQAFVSTIAVVGLALSVATNELRRAHRELEVLVNLASHDLQEPVRNTLGYADLLGSRYGAKLGDDGREFLGYIAAGAERMRKLIDDILALSRADRAGPPAEPADSGAALDAALAALEPQIRQSGAQISRERMPPLLVDGALLERLFENLVGNALKFRSAKAPCIHVAARRRRGGWVLSVRDNGIGVAAEDQLRIFNMFERLHGPARGGGAGLGLALCSRIVERHGGRMWVESAPMQGATFLFSLPGPDAPHG